MGAKPVFRATVVVNAVVVAAAWLNLSHASPGAERAAIIDLGPPNAAVRSSLARSLVEAGLEPVVGDGVEDALAGVASDRDSTGLAAAMADASYRFGQLDCPAAEQAARQALAVIAARQASGIAVPELSRAWAYVLLCADRAGNVEAGMRAAQGLHVATPNPAPDVAAVLAKYPAVDAVLGSDAVEVDIAVEDGAVVWIDFQPAGTAPLRAAVAPGEHVVAAAKGARRGSVSFRTSKAAQTVTVALNDQRAKWTGISDKVARWRGAMPVPTDLGWVLEQVRARIAIVRRGDAIEAWGRAGPPELPHRLGGADGAGAVADANRVAEALATAVSDFGIRAPDAAQPLLVDATRSLGTRSGSTHEPTKWWVYAAIGAAFAASAAIVYVHQTQTHVAHVELHYP